MFKHKKSPHETIGHRVDISTNFRFLFNLLNNNCMCCHQDSWSYGLVIDHSIAVQKMKFSIKDFFSKCDQVRRKLRISSHLLKKSLMEILIFCAVHCVYKMDFHLRLRKRKSKITFLPYWLILRTWFISC